MNVKTKSQLERSMQEEQIPTAFFGSLNQKAVYSGMSSLAFFVDVLLFRPSDRSALFTRFPELSPPNQAQPVPPRG
jgi:hypothetical protein